MRCDKERPGCSRCIAKGIECHYATKPSKVIGLRAQQSDNAPAEQRNSAHSWQPDFLNAQNQEASNDGDIVLDNALGISEKEIAELEREFFDWDTTDVNSGEFLNLQALEETMQQPIPCPNWSIPATPTFNPRALIQRPRVKDGEQRTSTLIQHTLKSYLLTMLRHNSLPPFVHQRLISPEFDMEPLTNCISLVHMIGAGMKGSRKLFWKNVRMECERLCAGVREVCECL